MCIGDRVGCVYPRRSTSLSPVSDSSAGNPPPNLVRVTFTSATIPPRQRSGLAWDDDGTPPDVFVRLYRGGELVYESEPVRDSLAPTFAEAITDNLVLTPRSELRLELWDHDPVRPEPIGTWNGSGLPRSAVPGANARIMLEGTANLEFRVGPPRAQRGSGITLYESRRNGLKLIEIVEQSPVGRAGIVVGDTIVAIDGESITELGDARAVSKISRVGHERSTVRVLRRDGTEEDVEVDNRFVWTTR